MANSLQDQLLKAGLTDKKKVKQANKEKRKHQNQQRRSGDADELKELAQRSLEEKNERNRELARQHNAAVEKKAIAAQIKQMIDVNCLSREGAEIGYNFSDGKHIKKILVSPQMQDHLSRGRLAIVRSGERYELVPAAVAEKIGQRDPQRVVVLVHSSAQEVEEDDPYADYQIPDDLMW